MNLIIFRSGYEGYHIKLTLGEDLEICIGRQRYLNCRFIKTTRKGFNILDLDTSRTLLKSHLYGIGMTGKEYPTKGPITRKFIVSQYVQIFRKQRIKVS